MRKWVKNFLTISISTFVGCGLIVLPFLFFLKPNNNIVLGNFQSYISNKLQNKLIDEYGITFQYYSSNAEIPTYIQNKTLDISIATNNMIAQLVINDDIQAVPWDKFNIILDNGNKVESYNDLEEFVTPATWKICKIIGNSIGIDNLLEYCVPYFMQKFVFGYRGEYIAELNKNAEFKTIFEYISNSSRFTSKNNSVMMIKDARTVYSVARLINNQSINPEKGILFNQNNDSSSIDELLNTYTNISNYYLNKDPNIMTFNSDSSIVLNKLSLNQINGGFMYNGDLIYSALGGDNPESAENLPIFDINNQNFWQIEPSRNFYAMDGFVFNKSLNGEKLNKAIQIVKDISLVGLNKDENIDQTINDEYKYTSMLNFSDILYTPCYSKLYEYAITDFFSEYGDEVMNFLIEAIKISDKSITINNIELPLNNLTESNLNIAFESFLEKI